MALALKYGRYAKRERRYWIKVLQGTEWRIVGWTRSMKKAEEQKKVLESQGLKVKIEKGDDWYG